MIGLGVVAVAVLTLFSACASSGGPKAVAGLDTRTTTIGGVDMTVTPTRLDNGGAAFTIALDTHTGALDIDVSANASLTVNGTRWTAPTWEGDGPGGHHRSGTLRFASAGPAQATAQLTISGLAGPLDLTWQLTP